MDTDFFSPSSGETDFDVLAVGSSYRDYRSLDRALEDDISAWVVGSDRLPTASKLRSLSCDYSTLVELYNRCMVVVLPLESTERSTDITALLGAMALGKAVIATRTDGVPDYLEHEREGLLVEAFNVRDLRESIRYLPQDASERMRLDHNARKRVLREYTTEKEAMRLCELIGQNDNS